MFSLVEIYEILSGCVFFIFIFMILCHLLCRITQSIPHLILTQNSTVIITGACMGIGRLMAQQIAKKYHCMIIIVDIRKDLFEQITNAIKKFGSVCECYYCDLSDDESINKFITDIVNRNQHIDLLISNAGLTIPRRVLSMKIESYKKIMQINYFATISIVKGLLPVLQNGHIAVIASMISIIDGGIDQSAYTASKHALYGFMASFRQQLKKDKKNITTSLGCPYAINTTMFKGFKTKLNFILPVLDEKYVAKRLIIQFIKKKQICFIYVYQSIVFKLMQFLPSQIIDWGAVKLDQSDFTHNKNLKIQ